MSIIACASAASALPFREPERRPHVTPLAERRAGGAERAGHDEHVAGPRPRATGNARAAADCGHRDDEHRPLRRVAADDRDTGLGDPLVELDHVLGPWSRRARRASRAALPAPPPTPPRSLRLTAAARQPRSRQDSQSSRKWTPSTSASCVTTRSPRAAPRRARRRRSGRAARAPRGARAHRSPRASSTACLQRRVGGCADDGDAGGARADAGAGVRARRCRRSRRPGRRPPRRSRAGPSRPIAGSASSFDGVSQIGPTPR